MRPAFRMTVHPVPANDNTPLMTTRWCACGAHPFVHVEARPTVSYQLNRSPEGA
jgi:hypothetical protein